MFRKPHLYTLCSSIHFLRVLAFSDGEFSGEAGGLSPGSPFGAAFFVAATPGSGFGGVGAFPCGGLYKGHAL
jgi:hypothetical protein